MPWRWLTKLPSYSAGIPAHAPGITERATLKTEIGKDDTEKESVRSDPRGIGKQKDGTVSGIGEIPPLTREGSYCTQGLPEVC